MRLSNHGTGMSETEQERVAVFPRKRSSSRKWSLRRTLLFVAGAGIILWTLIIALVLYL